MIKTIIKRNGQEVAFDKTRIFRAIELAFLSNGVQEMDVVINLTDEVSHLIELQEIDTIHVEAVQDIVEEALMQNNHLKVAKNYILYRERQTIKRQKHVLEEIKAKKLEIGTQEEGIELYNADILEKKLVYLSQNLDYIQISDIVEQVSRQIYKNIHKKDIHKVLLACVKEKIEKHYNYAYLASRVAVDDLYRSILKQTWGSKSLNLEYKAQFKDYIAKGIELDMLDKSLADFDCDQLADAFDISRDNLFKYLGMQILQDRYFLRDRSEEREIYELPQWFWMRVAMGLAKEEKDKEKQAIEFYHVLSKMDFVSSTPTLFNSGTTHSQMSSCYLNTVDDSLSGIFKNYSDNAQLSKWAGGIGTDWTPVRASGSRIKGTNGLSQGIIPFIKIFNDVALAVNQGGKRKGAMCAYLEVWHTDIEQFLELRKNTGDERRRAHDINTAAWIPDLFMKRIQEDGVWTLFCPGDTPDLHDLYGEAFEKKYEEYEAMNLSGAKTMKAMDLWRRLLTMLFETGHPWITFKDPMNIRNPQGHVGVIHSSNLCTEIALNTSREETAVCNLGSINLAQMITGDTLDKEKIERTVSVAIRMLDNVIDNNFYPTEEARVANLRHRAIGLGLMGYQDALYQLDIPFDSEKQVEFADESMELISYYAILASSNLAKERGVYETYQGSKWDQGFFPYDTLALLEKERGQDLKVNKATRLDWGRLKELVKEQGMRNCNTMAIAPTATIANIVGVYPCTEPAFRNLYMKENLSGNFVVINTHLMEDLIHAGLWSEQILNEIKLNSGSIQQINGISEDLKRKYQEVFEIDSTWIVKSAAVRGKWIDQSASTNIFLKTQSGKLLNDTYMMAWEYGLKTTYYLRTLGATQVIKMSTSTQDEKPEPKVCSILDPDCEACQ